MDESNRNAWSRTNWLAPVGAVVLWCAYPPLGIWPLAWVGLIPWVLLATERPDGPRWRRWRIIWLSSYGFWLGMNYYVTMPHWAGVIGWLAMSAYLCCYFPIFLICAIALQRTWRWPPVLAIPTAWVAMELLRAYVITGYGMGMLPHCFYQFPLLIQTADLVGGFGTSLLMLSSAAGITEFMLRRRLVFLIAAVVPLVVMLGYGVFQLQTSVAARSTAVVAIIQGSRDVVFHQSTEQMQKEMAIEFQQYHQLTTAARRRWPDVQLIVWPEGAFPQFDYLNLGDPSSASAEELTAIREARETIRQFWLAGIGAVPLAEDEVIDDALREPVPLLTGGNSINPLTKDFFNSALLFDRQGEIAMRYFKMHLVMFGEYVPLGAWFPVVYRWTPIPGAVMPGKVPQSFQISGVRFSPNICFESTVGHLMRRQILELADRGQEPDCLVNLTNDGWFFGTNCLDLHLACNVFRAVEMRKPVVVAANTGFSAHINDRGRLLDRGPRRQTAVLRAEVAARPTTSLYRLVGDWPAVFLTSLSLLAVLCDFVVAWRRRRNR